MNFKALGFRAPSTPSRGGPLFLTTARPSASPSPISRLLDPLVEVDTVDRYIGKHGSSMLIFLSYSEKMFAHTSDQRFDPWIKEWLDKLCLQKRSQTFIQHHSAEEPLGSAKVGTLKFIIKCPSIPAPQPPYPNSINQLLALPLLPPGTSSNHVLTRSSALALPIRTLVASSASLLLEPLPPATPKVVGADIVLLRLPSLLGKQTGHPGGQNSAFVERAGEAWKGRGSRRWCDGKGDIGEELRRLGSWVVTGDGAGIGGCGGRRCCGGMMVGGTEGSSG